MSIYFAKQSSLHAAIIMDGNGRWALSRGLPRVAGHRAGVQTVERIIEAAPQNGIRVLTLYAFSSDNWRRPPAEVNALMDLLAIYLKQKTSKSIANGVRIETIGRRDRLDPDLLAAIARTEAATAHGDRLWLRIAVDYSSRDAILAAARHAGAGELSLDSIASAVGPPVDVLIRTGGEQRLSDFLLWESAYAELVFSPKMWPEFTPADLASAVRDFHTRERRFGAIPPTPPPLREAWLD